MSVGIAGIYKEGKIELLETPAGLAEGRVRVIILEEKEPKPEPRYLEYGKYRNTGRRMSTEEDSKIAEWRGEDEDE